MQCSYRKFLPAGQFVFKNEAKSVEASTPGPEMPSGKPKESGKSPEDKAQKALADARTTCDEFSCKVEITKSPWQKEADNILEGIQKDRGLQVAFNTFLKEYARAFGQNEFEATEDISQNFYSVLNISGVPSSTVGFNAAWNDILRIAEKGAGENNASAKQPYERLKSIVDAVRNKESTQIAQVELGE